MIRRAAAVEVADRAFHALIGERAVGGDQQTVIAARRTVPYADALAHEIRCGIARCTRPLGNGDEGRIQLNRRPFVEDARMMRVHPRLDGRERGIGVLAYRKVPIKDRATCKEMRCSGHMRREVRAQQRPRKGIHKNVEDELSACGAVSETNWRTDNNVCVGAEVCRLIQTEKIRRRRIQTDVVAYRLRLCRERLSVRRAVDRNNCLRTLCDVNAHISRCACAAHDVEREVSTDVLGKPRHASDRVHQPSFVAIYLLIRVCADVVMR